MKGKVITHRTLREDTSIGKSGRQAEHFIVKVNETTYMLTAEHRAYQVYWSFSIDGDVVAEGDKALDEFTNITGMDYMLFQRYLSEIKYRKMKECCKKHSHWIPGYPGESLLICSVCNTVLDVQFNINEII